MTTVQRLSGLIATLEQEGDQARLDAARAAFNFKHSWLEMAQSLVRARQANRFVSWGYDSFLSYCEQELGLKKTVVDKLTVSYHVLERMAPGKLDSTDEDETIPSYQSLDYYARATGELRIDGAPPKDTPSETLSPELHTQLYDAVFEQGCTPKKLKDRFDPLIRPRTSTEEQRDHTRKTIGVTKKLLEMLPNLEGVDPELIIQAGRAIETLQAEMQHLIQYLTPDESPKRDDT